jgi:biopolymer transport protein ExbD
MPLKPHPDDLPAINLTPMIDILFNLIIFFLVSTRFGEIERQVDLAVPQVAGEAGLRDVPRTRTINIYRNGTLTLDGQPISLAELPRRLAADRQAQPKLEVAIRGDAQTPYQHVAAVIAACREAGIAELGIAVAGASAQRAFR